MRLPIQIDLQLPQTGVLVGPLAFAQDPYVILIPGVNRTVEDRDVDRPVPILGRTRGYPPLFGPGDDLARIPSPFLNQDRQQRLGGVCLLWPRDDQSSRCAVDDLLPLCHHSAEPRCSVTLCTVATLHPSPTLRETRRPRPWCGRSVVESSESRTASVRAAMLMSGTVDDDTLAAVLRMPQVSALASSDALRRIPLSCRATEDAGFTRRCPARVPRLPPTATPERPRTIGHRSLSIRSARRRR